MVSEASFNSEKDLESAEKHHVHGLFDDALAQIVGVCILEFGVALHRCEHFFLILETPC